MGSGREEGAAEEGFNVICIVSDSLVSSQNTAMLGKETALGRRKSLTAKEGITWIP